MAAVTRIERDTFTLHIKKNKPVIPPPSYFNPTRHSNLLNHNLLIDLFLFIFAFFPLLFPHPQNDRITKLKIDNNPFAKGFRELGQSRIKRKLPAKPNAAGGNVHDANCDKKLKTSKLFDYTQTMKESSKIGRKRSNSLSESTTSADESDNSVGDEMISSASSSLSGTSSPATSAHECNAAAYNESDDYAPLKAYDSAIAAAAVAATHHGTHLPSVGRHPSTEWIDLMTLRYIQANGNYPPPPPPPHHHQHHPHQSLFYAPNYESIVSFKQSPFMHHHPNALDLAARSSYEQMPSPDLSPLGPGMLDQTKKSIAVSPPKKAGFSISAILGCES